MRRPIAVLLGAVLLAQAWLVQLALHAREEARTAVARAARQGASPTVALAPGSALPTTNEGAGAAMLAGLLADRASSAGVRLVTRPGAVGSVPGLAILDVEILGTEAAVRAFARSVEGEKPLVRFLRWSLKPGEAGGLRLAGRIGSPLTLSDPPRSRRGSISVLDEAPDLHPPEGRGAAS